MGLFDSIGNWFLNKHVAALILAIQEEQAEKIADIVSKIPRDKIDEVQQGMTALELAVVKDNSAAATLLLANNANPEFIKKENKKSYVHLAAANGNLEVVKLIVEALKQKYQTEPSRFLNLLTARDAAGNEPLSLVHDVEVSRFLTDEIMTLKVSVSKYPDYIKAIEEGDSGILPAYVKKFGVDQDDGSKFKKSPLIIAIEAKQLSSARRLLTLDANPDFRTATNSSPLLVLCEKRFTSFFEDLVTALKSKYKAEPLKLLQALCVIDKGGNFPLAVADNEYKPDIEKVVAEISSLVIAAPELLAELNDSNLIELAIASNNFNFAKEVIKIVETRNAKTPENIIDIITNERVSALRKKIRNSAAVCEIEEAGSRAKERHFQEMALAGNVEFFHNAIQKGNVKLVRKFIEAKSLDMDVVSSANKWSGLMLAVKEGRLEIAEALLEAGATPDFRSAPQQDYSVLIVATGNGKSEVAHLILERLKVKYADQPQKLIEALMHKDSENDDVVDLCLNEKLGSVQNDVIKALSESISQILNSGGEIPIISGYSNLELACLSGNIKLAEKEMTALKEKFQAAPTELLNLLRKNGRKNRGLLRLSEISMSTEVRSYITAQIQQLSAQCALTPKELKAGREIIDLIETWQSKVNSLIKILDLYPAAVHIVRSENGASALYHAAFHERKNFIPLLLARGADPDVRTDKGYSPLNIALTKKLSDSAELIINALVERYKDEPAKLLAALTDEDQYKKSPLEKSRKYKFSNCASLVERNIGFAISQMQADQIQTYLTPNSDIAKSLGLREDASLLEKIVNTLSSDSKKMAAFIKADPILLLLIIKHDKLSMLRTVIQSLKQDYSDLTQVVSHCESKFGTPMHYAILEDKINALNIIAEAGFTPNVLFKDKTVTALAYEKNDLDTFLNLASGGGVIDPESKVIGSENLKACLLTNIPDAERLQAYDALRKASHLIKHVPKESNDKAFGAFIKVAAMASAAAKSCDQNHLTKKPDGSYYISPIYVKLIENSKGDWVNIISEIQNAKIKLENDTGRDQAEMYNISGCKNSSGMIRNAAVLFGLPLVPITLQNLVKEVVLSDEEMETLIEKCTADFAKLLIAGVSTAGFYNLNMRGMSLAQLLEFSYLWHKNLELIQDKTREIKPDGKWNSIFWETPEVLIKEGQLAGGKIINLCNTEDLRVEGKSMGNCISRNYTTGALAGKCHLFSFRDKDGNRRADMRLVIQRRGTARREDYRILIPNTNNEFYVDEIQGPNHSRTPNDALDALAWLKRSIESGETAVQVDKIGRQGGARKGIKKGSPLYEAIGTYNPSIERWEYGFQALLNYTAAHKRTKFLVPSSYHNPEKLSARGLKPVEAFMEDTGLADIVWKNFSDIKPEVNNVFSRVSNRSRRVGRSEVLSELAGIEVDKDFIEQLKQRGLHNVAMIFALRQSKPEQQSVLVKEKSI